MATLAENPLLAALAKDPMLALLLRMAEADPALARMLARPRGLSPCAAAAKKVYDLLKKRPEIDPSDLRELRSGAFCFRLKFPANASGVTELSVSFPTDAFGNREVDRERFPKPSCLETALFGEMGLIYREDLGYEDINRFYPGENPEDPYPELVDELVRELARLKDAISGGETGDGAEEDCEEAGEAPEAGES